MVRIDTITYKEINILICFDLVLLINVEAMYLKNPTSSKKIERKVIEKNSINIFSGLSEDDENKTSKVSLNETQLKSKINNAPIKLIIQ